MAIWMTLVVFANPQLDPPDKNDPKVKICSRKDR